MAYNEQSTERQRFRSFCERYLIARAPFFAQGREEEDAYHCMLNAKAIYNRLNAFSAPFEEWGEPAPQASQAAPPQAIQNQMNAVMQSVRAGQLSVSAAKAVINQLKGKPSP